MTGSLAVGRTLTRTLGRSPNFAVSHTLAAGNAFDPACNERAGQLDSGTWLAKSRSIRSPHGVLTGSIFTTSLNYFLSLMANGVLAAGFASG